MIKYNLNKWALNVPSLSGKNHLVITRYGLDHIIPKKLNCCTFRNRFCSITGYAPVYLYISVYVYKCVCIHVNVHM